MNTHEIASAILEDSKPRVRQAFRMLVAYPTVGRIEAPSPGFLVVALNKVCVHLDSDDATMAPETCEVLGLPSGSSYAQGVSVAKRLRADLARNLAERFDA